MVTLCTNFATATCRHNLELRLLANSNLPFITELTSRGISLRIRHVGEIVLCTGHTGHAAKS